jgi:hypothetical protein
MPHWLHLPVSFLPSLSAFRLIHAERDSAYPEERTPHIFACLPLDITIALAWKTGMSPHTASVYLVISNAMKLAKKQVSA